MRKDSHAPDFRLQELVGVTVKEGPNQYTNLQGIPEARQAYLQAFGLALE